MQSIIVRSLGRSHHVRNCIRFNPEGACLGRRHDVVVSLRVSATRRQRQQSLTATGIRSLSQRKRVTFEEAEDKKGLEVEEVLEYTTTARESSSRRKRDATGSEQLQFESLERDRSPLGKDPWDLEDMLNSKVTFDELPNFSPDHVSRISMERVKIHPDQILSLSTLAALPLPAPPMPHPGLGQAKLYALSRKRQHYKHILQQVSSLAESRVAPIQALPSWEDKQDAVDALFEDLEFELKEKEPILGKHPSFGSWVERALEEYLRSIPKPEGTATDENSTSTPDASSDPTSNILDDSQALPVLKDGLRPEDEPVPSILSPLSTKASEEDLRSIRKTEETATNENSTSTLDSSSDQTPTIVDDSQALPVFMDCFGPNDSDDEPVPSILSPLSAKASEIGGRMVEEWELSAHKGTRRILLRQSTRAVARLLLSQDDEMTTQTRRIFVHGRQGVGKTAALATIVACARTSGHIVLYLPDGDDLHKNGFYIEPNARRQGIFDLPVLSQQVCQQFLGSHQNELREFTVSAETLDEFFTQDQLKNLPGSGADCSLVDLLQIGVKMTSLAPMCLSAAIDVLMKQDTVPFLMVLDEFNCYFEPGHYFHADYDENVEKSIPYDRISLFKQALDAMAVSAVSPLDADEVFMPKPPVCMKRGGILVATSESRAVARKITAALVENVKWHQRQASDSSSTTASETTATKVVQSTPPIHLIEVPRFSPLEVEHVLANYEAIGIGKLRLDRGETVMNDQEVAYLRVVSGGVGQKLMDACIL